MEFLHFRKIGELGSTGFVQERPPSITVDMNTTVSIVPSDLVKNHKPIWRFCIFQTATGRLVKRFGKVEINLRLGRLELHHQVLVTELVNEAILDVDVVKVYGFLVNF